MKTTLGLLLVLGLAGVYGDIANCKDEQDKNVGCNAAKTKCCTLTPGATNKDKFTGKCEEDQAVCDKAGDDKKCTADGCSTPLQKYDACPTVTDGTDCDGDNECCLKEDNDANLPAGTKTRCAKCTGDKVCRRNGGEKKCKKVPPPPPGFCKSKDAANPTKCGQDKTCCVLGAEKGECQAGDECKKDPAKTCSFNGKDYDKKTACVKADADTTCKAKDGTMKKCEEKHKCCDLDKGECAEKCGEIEKDKKCTFSVYSNNKTPCIKKDSEKTPNTPNAPTTPGWSAKKNCKDQPECKAPNDVCCLLKNNKCGDKKKCDEAGKHEKCTFDTDKHHNGTSKLYVDPCKDKDGKKESKDGAAATGATAAVVAGLLLLPILIPHHN